MRKPGQWLLTATGNVETVLRGLLNFYIRKCGL